MRKMPEEADLFLRALGAGLVGEERLITCGIPGDPGDAGPTLWKPRPYAPARPGYAIPADWNAYVTVAVFAKAPDGTYRRRANCCRGGAALMVDDVGTKVDKAVVEHVQPTARVETSPGNEQWWYMFGAIERDTVKFDALIRAFIAGPLKGQDPGMASITRVARIPGYRNLKSAYGGVDVSLLSLNETIRFQPSQLIEAFGLNLMGERRPLRTVVTEDVKERIKAHFIVRAFLKRCEMLKRKTPDLGGWSEIHCPWVAGHTDGIDNGAAIREPHEENGFFGGFRCHHGSCSERTWRDLTEWVAEEAADQLNLINSRG